MGRHSRIELSVAPGYVSWGVWAALREFVQNAKDADDEGYPMKIDYFPRTKRLVISNEGTYLDRSTLVLGGTSKRNTNARGQFGEGYKLACATLLRLGKRVVIDNNDERWIPSLDYSETFNTTVLVMSTTGIKARGSVTVEIEGIDEDDWALAQSRLLFIKAPLLVGECNQGQVLFDSVYAANLYVGGIYVSKLDGNFKFGYNLNTAVRLDRDRQLANPWELKGTIREVLQGCVENESIPLESTYHMLNDEFCGEATVFADTNFANASEFSNSIHAFFLEENGDNAIPVASMGESIEAKHYGFKGVELSRALRSIIGQVQTPFTEVKKTQATDVSLTYSFDDLTEKEQLYLLWAVEAVSSVDDRCSLDNVSVVEFKGPKVMGSFNFQSKRISLRKSLLTDPLELISTLVHEVCHHDGGDGTVEHRDSCDRTLTRMYLAAAPPPR